MKAWILRHWLISLVATFVVGAGIAGAGATSVSKEPQLKRQLASAQADLGEQKDALNDALLQVEEAEAEKATLEERVASLTGRLAKIDAEWERLDAQTAELADLRSSLETRSDRLADATKRTNELESKLRAELHRVQNSTITEGTWQIGVDVEPGTYRAPGGASCYWAILNSLDNFDIANNGGFTANQTVQLSSGWFESNDCGEWKKIG